MEGSKEIEKFDLKEFLKSEVDNVKEEWSKLIHQYRFFKE